MSKHYFYKKGGSFIKIPIEDILYLEANDNHTKFYWREWEEEEQRPQAKEGDKKEKEEKPRELVPKLYNHLVRITLGDALALFPEEDFGRITKSYAISMEHVLEFGKEYAKFPGVLLEFPVFRPYYEQFLETFVLVAAPDKKGDD